MDLIELIDIDVMQFEGQFPTDEIFLYHLYCQLVIG
jgi:hypothetical protein